MKAWVAQRACEYFFEAADEGNGVVLSLGELLHNLLCSVATEDGVAGSFSDSFVLVSESEGYCSEVLRSELSEGFEALDFGEGESFGHALYEDEFSLWAEGEYVLGGEGADGGGGVVEEAVVEREEVFVGEVGDLGAVLGLLAQGAESQKAEFPRFESWVFGVFKEFFDEWGEEGRLR